jgi:polyhydroxyalkanoate synthesis regulator phasin
LLLNRVTTMEKNEAAKEKRALPEVFEKVWSHALLAVSTAEEEAAKVVSRLTEFAGWSQEETKRQVRELAERLTAQRKDLERNVEDGVKRAVGRLRLPRREELQAFEERLNQLSQRVEALTDKR